MKEKELGIKEVKINLTNIIKDLDSPLIIIDKRTGKNLAVLMKFNDYTSRDSQSPKDENQKNYDKNIKKTLKGVSSKGVPQGLGLKPKSDFLEVGKPCIHGILYHRGCHF